MMRMVKSPIPGPDVEDVPTTILDEGGPPPEQTGSDGAHELYSEFSNTLVDDLKRALVDHVWYEEDNFRLLKRHFQLMVWIDHSREWMRAPYDMSIQECLNLHQIGRASPYHLKLPLNLGVWPHMCGQERHKDWQ